MKVISFALWGKNPLYTIGAIKNCQLAKELMPDWNVWIYVNNTIPITLINTLTDIGATVINMGGDSTSCLNMMWRLSPALDSSVDLFISRDADSRLTQRELNMVNQWIESDKELHLIRDHSYHMMPIMGGMFGIKRGNLMNILAREVLNYNNGDLIFDTDTLNNLKKNNMYQFDEKMLENKLFNHSESSRLVHVSAGVMYDGDIIIPPPTNNDFIGNKINQDTDKPIIEYITGITRK